ncbi:MAG: hypothetical protein P4L55_18380 [Syntrophobacteraceae bacterium]|nr:hypothetical protein [Syntrophobacteraceae bacterium]
MIRKFAFVFFTLSLVTACANQYANEPRRLWQRPAGVNEEHFQRDVAACRAVGVASVPPGYKPFWYEGDPEQEWAQLQNQDPMGYRALIQYEKCMQAKGYVLEDNGFHPSQLKQFLKSQ